MSPSVCATLPGRAASTIRCWQHSAIAAFVEGDGYAGYGSDQPQFWVQSSEAPVPADDRSGLHFSFTASGRNAVDAFHAAALAAGGADNGKPGPRPDYGPNYYAAFVKDLDGYRIEAHAEIAA